MIDISNVSIHGWSDAIRGMRNPMNSWDKSDSKEYTLDSSYHVIGPNDHKLMLNLASSGPSHSKYRRMIVVYLDITAPLYWWKEFDTYKVGTVANSCSTMHKIHAKEFTLDDFSCENLFKVRPIPCATMDNFSPLDFLRSTVAVLNGFREQYLITKNKEWWWQMIQLLPSSYNQKRTVMLNYETLSNIYSTRKNHKLDEWRDFCEWIKNLPYSEFITGL